MKALEKVSDFVGKYMAAFQTTLLEPYHEYRKT